MYLFAINVSAQVHDSIMVRPLQSVNISLAGDASLISVNYEKLFSISERFIIATKIGLGYNEEFNICFGSCPSDEGFITIPHHVTANLGAKRNFFEFGLGGTMMTGNTARNYFFYPIVGYRFLPLRSNRLNFRIYAQIPITGLSDTDGIPFSPLGMSLGFTF